MRAGCGAGHGLEDPVCSREVFCSRPAPVPPLHSKCGWDSKILQSSRGRSSWAKEHVEQS